MPVFGLLQQGHQVHVFGHVHVQNHHPAADPMITGFVVVAIDHLDTAFKAQTAAKAQLHVRQHQAGQQYGAAGVFLDGKPGSAQVDYFQRQCFAGEGVLKHQIRRRDHPMARAAVAFGFETLDCRMNRLQHVIPGLLAPTLAEDTAFAGVECLAAVAENNRNIPVRIEPLKGLRRYGVHQHPKRNRIEIQQRPGENGAVLHQMDRNALAAVTGNLAGGDLQAVFRQLQGKAFVVEMQQFGIHPQ